MLLRIRRHIETPGTTNSKRNCARGHGITKENIYQTVRLFLLNAFKHTDPDTMHQGPGASKAMPQLFFASLQAPVMLDKDKG